MPQKTKQPDAGAASTRDMILSESLTLFALKGYEGTTVQDIASSVGIKAASLYAHFHGKEDIFMTVFNHAVESWSETITTAFKEALDARCLEDGLASIILRYVTHAANTDVFRFWTRLYVFPPAVLSRKDQLTIAALDAEFGRNLAEFCAAESNGTVSEIDRLVKVLVRITWGFMLCDSQEDHDGLESEIRENLRFILKSFSGT